MKKLSIVFLTALLLGSASASNVTKSELFPADWQGKRFTLIQEKSSVLTFKMAGNGRELAKNPPKLVIQVPEGIKLLHCMKRYGNRTPLSFTMENLVADGKKVNVYKINYPKMHVIDLNPKTFNWGAGHYIWLKADKNAKSGILRVAVEEKGKISHEHCIQLDILPPLEKFPAPLKKFRLGISQIAAFGSKDLNLFRNSAQYWLERSNKPILLTSWALFNCSKDQLQFAADNFGMYTSFHATRATTFTAPGTNFTDLGFMVNGKVVRKGVPKALDPNGKEMPGAICPQYLLKDPDNLFFDQYIPRAIKKHADLFGGKVEGFWLDYEPFVDYATCNDCLKAFAKFAKLDKVPARTDIRNGKPLNRKWREYKLIQHRTILEKMVTSVRKHYPQLKIDLCTTLPEKREKVLASWDCVDSSTVAPKIDSFAAMNYTTGIGYYNMVKDQMNHLKKTKLHSWVDPSEENERFFKRYTPESVQQNLIATVALGATGFVCYPTDMLDGRYYKLMDEALRAIAACEDIYFGNQVSNKLKWSSVNSKQISMKNEKGANVTLFEPDFKNQLFAHMNEKNNEYVITLLNYSNQTAFLKLNIPNFKGKNFMVQELLHKQLFSDVTQKDVVNGFMVQVPANDSLIIKIGKKVIEGTAVTQKDLNKKLEIWKKENKFNAFENKIVGDQALEWQIVDKVPVIKLKNGIQWLIINPAKSGGIIQWKNVNGTRTPLGSYKNEVLLGVASIYSDLSNENKVYQFKDVKLADNSASVTLSYVVPKDQGFGEENPLAGLQIDKSITLHSGTKSSGKATITHTFTNKGNQPMKFGYRLKNIPCLINPAKAAPLGVSVGGIEVFEGSLLNKGVSIPWPPVYNNRKDAPEDLTTIVKATWYEYTFKIPQSAGVYVWSSPQLKTVEPLYEEISLAPQKSVSFSMDVLFRQK